MKNVLFMSMLVSFFSITVSQAACYCMCVQNQKQWVCENSYDVPSGFCGGPCYGSRNEGPAVDKMANNKNESQLKLCLLDKSKTKTTK